MTATNIRLPSPDATRNLTIPLDVPCSFRGKSLGWIDCACQGRPQVFACRNQAVPASSCLLHAAGKPYRTIHLHDGGECPVTQALPVCALCRHRPARIVHVTHRLRWQDQVRRSEYALRAHDVIATSTEIVKPTTAQLAANIDRDRSRLVIAHGFSTPMSGFVDLASQRPDIRFVCVDHSSLNHTFTWPQYFAEYRLALEASRKLPNFWVAAVDQHASWQALGYPRFFTWHNPIFVPEDFGSAPIAPHNVWIVGRVDWMKGWPAQISAAALLQRETDCQVTIALHGDPTRQQGLQHHAAACGLRATWAPYTDYDGWYQRLRTEVSLVLQASMSDSYNIVSVEAALFGRPFVGSPTIPHTPRDWRVTNPNSPVEIASIAAELLDHYDLASARARYLGRRVASVSNHRYAKIIQRLLPE